MSALRALLQYGKHPLLVIFLLGQLIFLGILGLKHIGALESLDLMLYDFTLRSRPAQPVDTRIVLIDHTENDLRRWGFPVPDGTLAQVLEKLEQGGARIIGVDKYRDMPVAPGEAEFNQVLTRHKNIIWITKFGKTSNQRVPPPAVLANSDQIGFNDLIDDPNGVIRRGMLFLDDGKTSYTSFALVLAMRYLAPQGIHLQADEQHPDFVKIGKTTLPPLEGNEGGYREADAGGYQFLLDYRNMPSRLPRYSFTQLLEGRMPLDAVRGKIVIVGSTAKSLNDYFYTPYSGGVGENQRLFGIELHAQIVNQLLGMALEGGRDIRVLDEHDEGMLLWAVCTLAALLGFWQRSLLFFALGMLLGVGGLLGGSYFAILHSWWIPVVPSLLGWVIATGTSTAYRSSQERGQRKLLMQIFSSHVSDDVAHAMWQQREQFLDGHRPKPQQLSATVMFTDIRGFTTISEKMQPHDLFEWLNGYMEVMSGIVIQQHGVINKYIGDAIMALFGVPLPRTTPEEITTDARAAVECALRMRAAIEEMNRQREGQPALGMRIGINSGQLAAGTIGSSKRVEYTVIGDTVNIASRLESYKGVEDNQACRILISDATRQLIGDDYRTTLVGAIQLKGKDEAITIYQVEGRVSAG